MSGPGRSHMCGVSVGWTSIERVKGLHLLKESKWKSPCLEEFIVKSVVFLLT